MNTYHIHINGIVQGVGFRPFVYGVAQSFAVKGKVRNDANGVNLWFNADEEIAYQIFHILQHNAPARASIKLATMLKIAFQHFDIFEIDTTEQKSEKINTLLSPDYALCAHCKDDLYNPANRRYRYPFITCTQCGPRYSIINRLPYERYHTEMNTFGMCLACNKEYYQITDRRYFSQTNSCKDCGITMSLWKGKVLQKNMDTEQMLSYCCEAFSNGNIIAVKGTGGYLLMCDANNRTTIQKLRQRKHRPKKPFAILYPDIQSIKRDFWVSDEEANLLQSEAAPIVLLYPKSFVHTIPLAFDDIAPGLNTIGVMLPSNPLLELLVHDFGKPLIATSGNISGTPILYKDDDALNYLSDIADTLLAHNRAIIIPQDDSVVQFAPRTKQSVWIRRSRGYAPIYNNSPKINDQCILSLGALQKSTFAININANIFVSQYLGAGNNYEYQQTYQYALAHFMNVYQATPEVVLADMHPDYYTHQLAKEIAEKNNIQVEYIQHHQAHFAAVLAENNLLQVSDKILGIIWDGTGLGTDGNIWGGEFFLLQNHKMNRCTHFEYIVNISGDRMATDPRLCALSFCNHDDVPQCVQQQFSNVEFRLYSQLLKTEKLKTSSAGRLFDAVASILHLGLHTTYEGESAMYLQAVAEKYAQQHGYDFSEAYGTSFVPNDCILTTTWIAQIIADYVAGVDISFIAFKFHFSLVQLVKQVAAYYQVNQLCFSGGVFQNTLLVDLLNYYLKDSFKLYFHQQLSPNDENISFGQLYYYYLSQLRPIHS